ncbi:hypothetical protein FOZ63_020755, partial [Perkinsus olseni]
HDYPVHLKGMALGGHAANLPTLRPMFPVGANSEGFRTADRSAPPLKVESIGEGVDINTRLNNTSKQEPSKLMLKLNQGAGSIMANKKELISTYTDEEQFRAVVEDEGDRRLHVVDV